MDAWTQLQQLGASALPHVNGDLLEHLRGTYDLLRRWGNRDALCVAGLYHSVYGTEAYDMRLVTSADRGRIVGIIGAEAERIVYDFSVCDRDQVYLPMLRNQPPVFRNRFTGQVFSVDDRQMADFCELTMANEIQIVMSEPDSLRNTNKIRLLSMLFAAMRPCVSAAASAEWVAVARSI